MLYIIYNINTDIFDVEMDSEKKNFISLNKNIKDSSERHKIL